MMLIWEVQETSFLQKKFPWEVKIQITFWLKKEREKVCSVGWRKFELVVEGGLLNEITLSGKNHIWEVSSGNALVMPNYQEVSFFFFFFSTVTGRKGRINTVSVSYSGSGFFLELKCRTSVQKPWRAPIAILVYKLVQVDPKLTFWEGKHHLIHKVRSWE